MTFNVEFDERAFKEWNKLEKTIREQFKKKLKKLQQNPYVESARLHGDLAGCFKIKLRASGFRLIYKVIDDEIVIWVVAVGKREDEKAYEGSLQNSEFKVRWNASPNNGKALRKPHTSGNRIFVILETRLFQPCNTSGFRESNMPYQHCRV
jgi:mRNA interferase RelE/StbE